MWFIKPKLTMTYLIFLEHIKTNLHLNRNVRPTLKCLGARLKKYKNAKKVLGSVPIKESPGHSNGKLISLR